MSTLGMRPRLSQQIETSESTNLTSPKADSYEEWKELLWRRKTSGEQISEEETNTPVKDKGKGVYRAPAVALDGEEEEEEEEGIKNQPLQSSNPYITPPETFSPTTSEISIDSSEEEIRLTLAAMKQRDAAQHTPRHYSRDKAAPPREPEEPPSSIDFFRPWTWPWEGPSPFHYIPIPPPMNPRDIDPIIEIRYTCTHCLPTLTMPSDDPNVPPDPSKPIPNSTLSPMPFKQIQTIRAAAKNDKLDHIVAGQDSLCPNCVIWWQWFAGLVFHFLMFGVMVWAVVKLGNWGRAMERERRGYRVTVKLDLSGLEGLISFGVWSFLLWRIYLVL